MICLELTGKTLEECLSQFNSYRQYADCAEVRFECLDDPYSVSPEMIRENIAIPLSGTFRMGSGNRADQSSARRRELISACAAAGFDYLELDEIERIQEAESVLEKNGGRIIRRKVLDPASGLDLDELIGKLVVSDTDIPRFSINPGGSREALKLCSALADLSYEGDKLADFEGIYGFAFRILYRKFGFFTIFCSPESRGEEAKISPEDASGLYRTESIGPDTALYGIIGNPVMHTKSPGLHNSAYIRAGMNAVYVPFPVDDLDAFFRMADILGIRGLSVTVPFKESVLDFLSCRSSEIDSIGSCNTVFRNKEGKWKGYNTDLEGFLNPLKKRVKLSSDVSCAVIGAGGASRAVVTALKNAGCKVSLFNRSEERGRKLAFETGSDFFSLSRFDLLSGYDIIVQTTSVGMSPDTGVSPVPPSVFSPIQTVYDIVYTPLETRFLKDAEAAGCRTIGGMEMLIGQGIRQFEIFTGQDFPAEEQTGNS